MRGLSETFMSVLNSGFLEPILNMVQSDPTLCLEIRKDYINIYYRGGNILKVEEKNNLFNAEFNSRYLKLRYSPEFYEERKKIINGLPQKISVPKEVEKWIECFPLIKDSMDLWFGENPKDEREFQQLMLRENNFGNAAKSTDYFICDIEYTQPNTVWRFDLIAVNWPSSSSERKNNKNLGIAFIEIKYMDHALTGNAGLKKHIKDINDFLKNPANLSNIKDEMKKVFNQKRELGLIDNQKPIESFSDNKPEYIFALANHDPASSRLKTELQTLPPCQDAELKFVVSNFLGYGLYDQNIYTLDVFLKRFEKQI